MSRVIQASSTTHMSFLGTVASGPQPWPLPHILVSSSLHYCPFTFHFAETCYAIQRRIWLKEVKHQQALPPPPSSRITMCHQYQLLLLHDFESSCSIFFTKSLQNPFNPQHNMAKKNLVYPEKQNQLHLLDELCSCCCYIMCLLQSMHGYSQHPFHKSRYQIYGNSEQSSTGIIYTHVSSAMPTYSKIQQHHKLGVLYYIQSWSLPHNSPYSKLKNKLTQIEPPS